MPTITFSLKDLQKLVGKKISITELEELLTYAKAEIARSVWDDAGFFPIYNDVSNESFVKALTLFDEAQALVSSYK